MLVALPFIGAILYETNICLELTWQFTRLFIYMLFKQVTLHRWSLQSLHSGLVLYIVHSLSFRAIELEFSNLLC